MNDRDGDGGPLSGLDPEQRAAATAPRGPVCVLAGAGTGKTRTITHRIAYLVRQGHVSAGQVLAVTFTARAAGELRNRLRHLGVEGAQARTFHAAALKQLRYFWPRVVGEEPWELLDGKLKLVGQAAHRVGVSTERDVLRDVASEIEWSKASLVGVEDYAAVTARLRRDLPAPAAKIGEVYAAYEELKSSRRLLDFDDLLLHTTAAIEQHRSVAEEFRQRYRCFVVDEYQDVTPLQQRLLEAWLGGRDDITVVGDANQTIYSFGGASPQPLLEFTRRYPDATVVRLERDYRSTPQVVSLANSVIAGARARPAAARLRLVGQRQAGPEPVFNEFDDEPAEADAVARRIRELVDSGVPASEIAVLYRVNAQSESYERALAEVTVPYVIRGGERFFSRREVRAALTALRSAAGEGPEHSADAGAPADVAGAVRAVLEPLGLTTEPPQGATARERWDALAALAELARDFAASASEPSLGGFVAELEHRASAQHPPTVEGVTLTSLHAAKGLEWDAVFLVGLTDGTMPIQHAEGSDSAIEEERRLLYVGLTRAREHLWLSWSLARNPGGRRSRRRSRFLRGVAPDDQPGPGADGRTRGKKGRAKAGCRVCGSRLAEPAEVSAGRCAQCPSDVDEELLARLKEWRGRRARELSVPAYVVFTDATLVAIAEQRPADDRGLVAIPGIGATKLERFGADVLELVRGDGASAASASSAAHD
ncbi:DNA helicase-2 / ATP-dependent DNA helicase PcrA [Haloechinothrix alba]|uniref:DNA 3'-5' helicase n=1 Tax=Haloechinothrix alba TaxID=664784 RepID=A0A238ZT13_9PSEU|nr:ATP-dependent DNA helicase UvrD2 [Haloechinothrix alba]SNR86359.1 DNA helicase-2 / ATP-dependent DNA helicase PcrA [Haloechinothrix alba]